MRWILGVMFLLIIAAMIWGFSTPGNYNLDKAPTPTPPPFGVLELRCENNEVFIHGAGPIGSFIHNNGVAFLRMDTREWKQTTTGHQLLPLGSNQAITNLNPGDTITVRLGTQVLASQEVPTCN